jgi:release factor glutamine methyltransferase
MSENLQTLKDIRQYISKELNELYQKSEIPILSDILIKTATGIKKLHQLYNPGQPVTSDQSAYIAEMCLELKSGKPIQYILGETSFYNCTIRLNDSTLIPRPETEEMVDLIIRENRGFTGTITDIGTGSGCIAIALAANLPESSVTGIDISSGALKAANENAALNNVKVIFREGDIFKPYTLKPVEAGIIVSNPPYVLESEKKLMQRNVLEHEPSLALYVPDNDPVVYYKAILKMANAMLIPNGKIYFEINEKMGSMVCGLMEKGYSGISIIKDINGKDRIIKGLKNG